MRKPYKFLLAAVALLATTACSSDDSRAEEQTDNAVRKGQLVVTVEPMELDDVSTRAYRSYNNNYLEFVADDGISLYTDLTASLNWDLYSYKSDTKKFMLNGDQTITDNKEKYAFFPATLVRAGFKDVDGSAKVQFRIPRDHTVKGNINTFDASALLKNCDGLTLSRSDLPMFGYVTGTADGGLQAKNLRHLTAVVRLNVKDIKQKAKYLCLTTKSFIDGADDAPQLSGTFTATLSADESARKDTKLAVIEKDMVTYGYMIYDVSQAPEGETWLYMPVLAGVNGSDLRLLSSSKDAVSTKSFKKDEWTERTMTFPAKTMKQNCLYVIDFE